MTLEQMKKQHQKLVGEIDKLQKDHEGEAMPANVGEEIDAKATEALELQERIDTELKRSDRLREIREFGDRIPDPALPGDPRVKTETEPDERPIAGYMTLGDFVATTPEYQKWVEQGGHKSGNPVQIPVPALTTRGMRGTTEVRGPNGDRLIPITAEERKAREAVISERFESKAATSPPTLGTGVIDPQRVSRIPQVTADDELTLRDVLDVQPMGASGSLEYVREEAFTRAAAETAHGSTKPEAALEYTLQSADVRTVAATLAVHNQQLSDWPQLRGLIDNRLLYDLSKREEEQVIYGDGNAPNLEGLEVVSGTTDISGLTRYSATGHTIIDVVRMGITEVRRSGYRANAVLIDPIDWEEVILQKGTDNHYVWVIVTDENGSRIWSLRVVESESMEANEGNPTEQRNLLVGDFRRGATLYDRMQSTIMVGVVDKQFTRNMRTILAEERVAFPIFAPAAFAKFETQALST